MISAKVDLDTTPTTHALIVFNQASSWISTNAKIVLEIVLNALMLTLKGGKLLSKWKLWNFQLENFLPFQDFFHVENGKFTIEWW